MGKGRRMKRKGIGIHPNFPAVVAPVVIGKRFIKLN